MVTPTTLAPDDLVLAQALLRQFGRRVKGLTSIGLPICFNNICDPKCDAKAFLHERLEDLQAFLCVLRVVTRSSQGKGRQDEWDRRIRQLRDSFFALVSLFDLFIRNRELTIGKLRHTAENFGEEYRRLFEVLHHSAVALGMESNFSAEGDFGQQIVTGLLAEVLTKTQDQKPDQSISPAAFPPPPVKEIPS